MVKGGGRLVMVYGGVVKNGTGPILLNEGIMDQPGDKDIIK